MTTIKISYKDTYKAYLKGRLLALSMSYKDIDKAYLKGRLLALGLSTIGNRDTLLFRLSLAVDYWLESVILLFHSTPKSKNIHTAYKLLRTNIDILKSYDENIQKYTQYIKSAVTLISRTDGSDIKEYFKTIRAFLTLYPTVNTCKGVIKTKKNLHIFDEYGLPVQQYVVPKQNVEFFNLLGLPRDIIGLITTFIDRSQHLYLLSCVSKATHAVCNIPFVKQFNIVRFTKTITETGDRGNLRIHRELPCGYYHGEETVTHIVSGKPIRVVEWNYNKKHGKELLYTHNYFYVTKQEEAPEGIEDSDELCAAKITLPDKDSDIVKLRQELESSYDCVESIYFYGCAEEVLQGKGDIIYPPNVFYILCESEDILDAIYDEELAPLPLVQVERISWIDYHMISRKNNIDEERVWSNGIVVSRYQYTDPIVDSYPEPTLTEHTSDLYFKEDLIDEQQGLYKVTEWLRDENNFAIVMPLIKAEEYTHKKGIKVGMEYISDEDGMYTSVNWIDGKKDGLEISKSSFSMGPSEGYRSIQTYEESIWNMGCRNSLKLWYVQDFQLKLKIDWINDEKVPTYYLGDDTDDNSRIKELVDIYHHKQDKYTGRVYPTTIKTKGFGEKYTIKY